MVTVALAGGSSRLGAHIAAAILRRPQHKLILLTRSASLSFPGATIKPVDYSSEASLTAALAGVNTLISCLWVENATDNVATNENLLAACKAAGVKRFAPSEFAFAEQASHGIDLYEPKIAVWERVKKSGLEFTAFRNGIFMNYLAFQSPRPDWGAKAFGGIGQFPFILDLSTLSATVPGDGNQRISMTRTQDVGEFVAEALELESWPEELGMAGSTVTYNQVVEMAERIMGKKVDVTYKSIEELEKEIEGKKEGMERFFAQCLRSVAKGEGEVKPVLNGLVDFKPMGVEEFLRTWWGVQE